MKLSMCKFGFVSYIILVFIGVFASIFTDKGGVLFAPTILLGWLLPCIGWFCDGN